MWIEGPQGNYEKSVKNTPIKIDGNLTRAEKNFLKEKYSKQKEQLLFMSKEQRNPFLEKDYGAESKKWLGSNAEVYTKQVQEYFKIPQTGEYNMALLGKIIRFQRENGLTVDGILGMQTYRSIAKKIPKKAEKKNENPKQVDSKKNQTKEVKNSVKENKSKNESGLEGLKKSPNLKELLDTSINEVLKKAIGKLNSKEGISFNYNEIYNDLTSTLSGISDKLGSNIFKKDFDKIVDNFLKPKKTGIQNIKFLTSRLLGSDKKEIGKDKALSQNEIIAKDFEKNIDNYYSLLKGAVSFLFDSAKGKTTDQIKSMVNEFTNIKAVDSFFKKAPDIKKFLVEVLPTVLNSTDKNKFIEGLDSLYKNSRDSIVYVANDILAPKNIDINLLKKHRLNLINNISSFVFKVSNKDNVSSISKGLSKLNVISQNDISRTFIDMINYEGEEKKDKKDNKGEEKKGVDKILRHRAFRAFTNFMEASTRKEVGKTEIKKIDRAFNILVEQINEVAKNTDPSKLNLFVRSIEKFVEKNKSSNDKGTKLKVSFYNKISLGIKNIKYAPTFVENYLGNKGTASLVTKTLQNGIIDKNIAGAGNQISKQIQEVLGIRVSDFVKQARDSLGKKEFLLETSSNFERTKNNFNKEGFIGVLLGDIGTELLNSIKGKLEGKDKTNLTKENMIKLISSKLESLIEKRQDLFFKFLKELGLKVQDKGQKDIIKKTVKNILKHPSFGSIVGKLLTNIGNNIKNHENIISKLKGVVSEASKTKGKSLLDKKIIDKGVLEKGTDIVIDNLYVAISTGKNINSVLSLIEQNSKIDLGSNKKIIKDMLLAIGGHVDKNNLKGIIKKNLSILKTKPSKEQILSMVKDVYNSVGDKPKFLDSVLKVDFGSKLGEYISKKFPKLKLGSDKLSNLIKIAKSHINGDMIFKVFENNSDIISTNKPSASKINKIITELYGLVEDKTGLINSVLDTGIIPKRGEKSGDKANSSDDKKIFYEKLLSESNIDASTRLIFSTLEFSNKKDVSFTITNIFEKAGLSNLLDIKILGNSFSDNVVLFLNSMGENKFNRLIKNNKNDLIKLVSGNLKGKEKIQIYTKIGKDILSKIDVPRVQKELGNNVDGNKKLALGMLDEFQTVVKENSAKIDEVTSKGYDLYNLYNKKPKYIVKPGTGEAKNIVKFGENAFNLLNSMITKVGKDYLEKNLVIPKGSSKQAEVSKKQSEFAKLIKSSFLANNKLFLVKQGLSVLGKFKIDKPGILYSYLSNKKNADNFGNTVLGLFLEKKVPKNNRRGRKKV